MELRAAIEALKAIKKPCMIEIVTDSQYVKKGITEWIQNWKKNNWVSASKQPVANKDLWLELDRLNQQHQVQWHWVKGHNDNPNNEVADKLAVKAAKNPTEIDCIKDKE